MDIKLPEERKTSLKLLMLIKQENRRPNPWSAPTFAMNRCINIHELLQLRA